MGDRHELQPAVRSKVEDFTQQLVGALGSDLAAVVVHGSGVRGGYRPGQSDIDVVVVLERDTRASLEAAGEVLVRARAAHGVEATLVTVREIHGAADVFPLLYDELVRESVCVYGGNPFARIVVKDTYRRLRIEQELRRTRMALRRSAAEARGERAVLRRVVWQILRRARSPLGALLKLLGHGAGSSLDEILTRAGLVHGIPCDALVGEIDDPFAAYDVLCTLLDTAIDGVDRLAHGDGAPPAAAAWASGGAPK